MLDFDLAEFYGVTTGRLNEQVKRNQRRFPRDFMFRLTKREQAEVIAKCENPARLKFAPKPPLAFSEHGAVMLASVLRSPAAVRTSVLIVRAFNHLREVSTQFDDLRRGIARNKRRLSLHEAAINRILDALHAESEGAEPLKRIGFQPLDEPGT